MHKEHIDTFRVKGGGYSPGPIRSRWPEHDQTQKKRKENASESSRKLKRAKRETRGDDDEEENAQQRIADEQAKKQAKMVTAEIARVETGFTKQVKEVKELVKTMIKSDAKKQSKAAKEESDRRNKAQIEALRAESLKAKADADSLKNQMTELAKNTSRAKSELQKDAAKARADSERLKNELII